MSKAKPIPHLPPPATSCASLHQRLMPRAGRLPSHPRASGDLDLRPPASMRAGSISSSTPNSPAPPTRLYACLWKFPDAAGLRGVSFSHLRELGLCCAQVEIELLMSGRGRLGSCNTSCSSWILQFGSNGTLLDLLDGAYLRFACVCSRVLKDIKVLPTFCRCFPRIEELHIMSATPSDPE